MQETPSNSQAAWTTPRESAGRRLARLGRLARKELRETLRDRRTIATLLLMPLLLYPLLSVGFRQLFTTSMSQSRPSYRVAVRTPVEGRWIGRYLRLRDQQVNLEPSQRNPAAGDTGQPSVEVYLSDDPQASVLDYSADVAVVFLGPAPVDAPEPSQDLELSLQWMHRRDSLTGANAAEYLERRLAEANARFLTRRLAILEIKQRATPVVSERVLIGGAEEPAAGTLLTLAPLILILMTITGAVYPAIDLTAGERERGTLEILVAAPVPRLGLLLAKYVSVLTVALLTASVNLLAMAATVVIGGLGPAMFGETGLTVRLALEVLGLLLLFATFFSAVLLTLTSFARTFKEAQAYLIPLMMVAIAPGLLSLMPHVELTGALTITPLVNIVLLARDLLRQQASGTTAMIVVISTMLYSLAAIGIAARFFAAEAVLYTTESGWSDLFQRPRMVRAVPNPANAMFCAAVIFSAFFVAINTIRLAQTLQVQLAIMGLATVGVFAGLPLLAAIVRRIAPLTAFRCQVASWNKLWLALPGAPLLGCGLWAWAHELVVVELQLGLIHISDAQQAMAMEQVRRLQELNVLWVLLPFGLAPALGEELFFRGYLFSALKSKAGPWSTILVTAALFGLFHVVSPSGISLVRLAPSTLLGVALGWVAWRTGSVWPSIALHGCHNSLLMLAAYYQPRLAQAGIGIEEESHLPLLWLAAATAVVLLGGGWIIAATRDLPPSPLYSGERGRG